MTNRILVMAAERGGEEVTRWYLRTMQDSADSPGYDFTAGPLLEATRILLAEPNDETAYAVAHIAARVHGDDPDVQFLHGEVHRRAGEDAEAVLAFNRVREDSPNHPGALARLRDYWGADRPRPLGEVLLDAARDEGLQAAASEFRKLRSTFLNSGLYDFSTGALNDYILDLIEDDLLDEALVLAHLNGEFNGGDFESHLLHGEIHRLRRDREDERRIAFQTTRTVAADTETARDRLRDALDRIHGGETYEVTPLLADAEVAHGDAHRILQQPDLAEAAYRRVLEVVPDHEGAREGLRALGR